MLCNATVTSLRRNGSRIDGVTVRSRDGRRLTIPSDVVVLCVGGIEAPRMLLERWPISLLELLVATLTLVSTFRITQTL